MPLSPTSDEVRRRDAVFDMLLTAIRGGQTVRLPAFDPENSQAEEHAALLSIGSEPNPFGATVGAYRYQFEGEDDLLHLIVSRLDGLPASMEECQEVARFLWPDVPIGLVWAKPGHYSHHFYLGHDVLLDPPEAG